MRTLMMVVLYLAWLVLIYGVGASAFVVGINAMTGKMQEPDLDLSATNLIAAINGFWVLVGIGVFFLRRRLFWLGSKTVETIGGYLLFGLLSALTFIGGLCAVSGGMMPYFQGGPLVYPIVGIVVGLVFLYLTFPRMPKREPNLPEA